MVLVRRDCVHIAKLWEETMFDLMCSKRRLAKFVGGALASVSLAVSAPFAAAEPQGDYPARKLNIVVAFDAGGSADRLARAVARFLPEELGVPVTVENRPGGAGALGHTYFLNAPDDGSTAMITPVSPYLISNIVRGQGKLDWDAFDFVNGQWEDFYVLLVNKDQPFQTLDELISFMEANPGEASSAIIVGDVGHVSTLVMLDRLGLPQDTVNFVTYDGGGAMRTALAGNQVTFSIIPAMGSEVISDDVRALAVFSKTPNEVWDAPLIDDALAQRGVEMPILSTLRVFTLQKSFKEANPEAYRLLVDAYKRTLEREDFAAFAAEGSLGTQWMGPAATQAALEESYERFEQYADFINK